LSLRSAFGFFFFKEGEITMGHNERDFENILAFTVSKDGKVMRSPLHDVQSTSAGGLQEVLLEIAPQVAKFIEKLLAEKRMQMKFNDTSNIKWE
jgi:hypothetical protein